MSTVFGEALRQWRRLRKLSQFDLALTASVSQRHLSYLENGRSRPSRPMVMQLADALDVPLRDRNQLLSAAGFAAIYQERGLDAEQMTAVRRALEQILSAHDPFPCFAFDRLWNIVLMNRATSGLFGNPEDYGLPAGSQINIAELTLSPTGLRPLIANFDELLPSFLTRLRRDQMRYIDDEAKRTYERFFTLVDDSALPKQPADAPLLPTLTLELNLLNTTISLFSVIATFGTPQDVTTDELRIESMFPADEHSREVLIGLAELAER